MSRVFQKNNKDLINLEVVTSDKVWDISQKRKGKPTFKKGLKIYGRIDKGTSAMITSTNLIGENHKFVEDTHNLPKNLKNKIVNLLKNEKRRVVYLVRKDS